MPTDDSDDDLDPPPLQPPTLTRGDPRNALLHLTPDLDEPPSPPRLTRSSGYGFNGQRMSTSTPSRAELFEPDSVPLFPGLSLASAPSEGRMRRGPSPAVEGDEITRAWIRHPPNFTESPLTPSSGSWTESEEYEEDPFSWWFDIPQELRTDVYWNHMFKQPDFFLVDKKIKQEKREAIDTIMRLLPIGYKSIYNTSTRRQPLKSPFPKVVNVAFVKQYLTNMTPVLLTPEDRYRFEMMIMNFLMFAPMSALDGYLERLSIRGGKKTRHKRKQKKTRKHKTKRV